MLNFRTGKINLIQVFTTNISCLQHLSKLFSNLYWHYQSVKQELKRGSIGTSLITGIPQKYAYNSYIWLLHFTFPFTFYFLFNDLSADFNTLLCIFIL